MNRKFWFSQVQNSVNPTNLTQNDHECKTLHYIDQPWFSHSVSTTIFLPMNNIKELHGSADFEHNANTHVRITLHVNVLPREDVSTSVYLTGPPNELLYVRSKWWSLRQFFSSASLIYQWGLQRALLSCLRRRISILYNLLTYKINQEKKNSVHPNQANDPREVKTRKLFVCPSARC